MMKPLKRIKMKKMPEIISMMMMERWMIYQMTKRLTLR
jgi:hypothetical protein